MVRRRNRKFVLTSGLGQWMIVTVGMVLLDCFLAAVLEPTVFASIQWPLRLLELSMIVGVGGIFAAGCWLVSDAKADRSSNHREVIPVAPFELHQRRQVARAADQDFALQARESVIFGLAKLSESRGREHDSHLDRLRDYVRVLANALRDDFPQIDDRFVHNLCLASALHDIGMVGISDEILQKPEALSKADRDAINRHPLIGGECLADLEIRPDQDQFLRMACDVARHHHERWDGLGYPSGLRDEQIPLAARIVCVADVYDALTTDRPYKQAMPHAQAVAILEEGAGRQFDPRVVEAFIECEERFQAIKHGYGLMDDNSFEDRFNLFQEFVAQIDD